MHNKKTTQRVISYVKTTPQKRDAVIALSNNLHTKKSVFSRPLCRPPRLSFGFTDRQFVDHRKPKVAGNESNIAWLPKH